MAATSSETVPLQAVPRTAEDPSTFQLSSLSALPRKLAHEIECPTFNALSQTRETRRNCMTRKSNAVR
jgi:hypothetical protein